MRKRKVFRETVITVIVIAFWCKAMVSLYQNYELVFLTEFVFWGCWKPGHITPFFYLFITETCEVQYITAPLSFSYQPHTFLSECRRHPPGNRG